jgi:hypothetical protein
LCAEDLSLWPRTLGCLPRHGDSECTTTFGYREQVITMAWAKRLARRVGFGRNSLRRNVDRVDGVLFGLTVLVAVAIPVGGVFVGIDLGHYEAAVSAEQLATRTATTAVLVEDAERQGGLKAGEADTSVMARWTGPDGTVHSGRISTVSGQSAGKAVSIWVDRDGKATSAPIGPVDATACAVITALAAVSMAEALLFGVAWLLRWPMDNWRDNAWDSDWEQTASRWKQGMI